MGTRQRKPRKSCKTIALMYKEVDPIFALLAAGPGRSAGPSAERGQYASAGAALVRWPRCGPLVERSQRGHPRSAGPIVARRRHCHAYVIASSVDSAY